MRAIVIAMETEQSRASARVLLASHEKVGNPFELEKLIATTPENVAEHMEQYRVVWDYPWEGTRDCEKTGLRLHAYTMKGSATRESRMACFMSHFRLWAMAARSGEPILVLEDDAVFTQRLRVIGYGFGAIGINDPHGATRKADLFHEKLQRQTQFVCPVPIVDKPNVPQGLAGHSAYIIRPWAAAELCAKVREIGAWPNDAIMCQQLFEWLGVTRQYYTTIQHTPSTLSR